MGQYSGKGVLFSLLSIPWEMSLTPNVPTSSPWHPKKNKERTGILKNQDEYHEISMVVDLIEKFSLMITADWPYKLNRPNRVYK